MLYVYFVYGLAFFSLGIVLGLQQRTPVNVLPRQSMRFLAGFGITHGVFEWIQALEACADGELPPALARVELPLLVISFALLFLFGAQLLRAESQGRRRPVRWTRAAALGLVALYSIGLLSLILHFGNDPDDSEVLIRYGVALPAATLSGVGMLLARNRLSSNYGEPLRTYLRTSAIVFFVYAISAGLIGPSGSVLPASVLNVAAFQSLFGFPIVMVRTLCAVLLVVFLSQAFTVEVARTQTRLSAMREEFLSVLSHDIRNALGGIQLSTEAMRRLVASREVVDEREVRLVDGVLRGVRTVSVIATDLLDASLLEANRLPLKMQNLDVAKEVMKAVERARQEAEGRTIELRTPDRPVSIMADPLRLDQVLMNLLLNAIKYSFPESLISVTVEEHASGVVVSVQNPSEVIPAEQLRQLFQRFFRTDSARRMAQGTGLGLFIVKGIVEAHHGKVGVVSEAVESPSRGRTAFTVTFPRVPSVSL